MSFPPAPHHRDGQATGRNEHRHDPCERRVCEVALNFHNHQASDEAANGQPSPDGLGEQFYSQFEQVHTGLFNMDRLASFRASRKAVLAADFAKEGFALTAHCRPKS